MARLLTPHEVIELVACPKCGAPRKALCWDKDGHRMHMTVHHERTVRAQKMVPDW